MDKWEEVDKIFRQGYRCKDSSALLGREILDLVASKATPKEVAEEKIKDDIKSLLKAQREEFIKDLRAIKHCTSDHPIESVNKLITKYQIHK